MPYSPQCQKIANHLQALQKEKQSLSSDLDKGTQLTLNFNKGGNNAEDYFGDDADRRFTNMTHDQSNALVKDLKAAGAKSITGVDFVDVQTANGGAVSLIGGIVIELPEDPAARKKLFAIRADLLKSLGQPEVMVQSPPSIEPCVGRPIATRHALRQWSSRRA